MDYERQRAFTLVELMIALAIVERRQQLAFRQIAGAAENDEVERVDRNDLACHVLSVLPQRIVPRLYNLIDLI